MAIARLRPALVRSVISSRSNSAIEASRVESERPCANEVSHPRDRNDAPGIEREVLLQLAARWDRLAEYKTEQEPQIALIRAERMSVVVGPITKLRAICCCAILMAAKKLSPQPRRLQDLQ